VEQEEQRYAGGYIVDRHQDVLGPTGTGGFGRFTWRRTGASD
jgi:hypothetical protein